MFKFFQGPFLQTDEVIVQTYENQRWNAISGIFGEKTGYSKIGL